MKKLVFSEIKKYILNKYKLSNVFRNFRLLKYGEYSELTFKLKYFNEKRFKKFKKEHLGELRKIAKRNDYFVLIKYFYSHDFKFGGIEMVLKKIKYKKANLNCNKLYHLTLKKNRQNILKQGLIKNSFFKSRWIKFLHYYYKPCVFLTKEPEEITDFFKRKYKRIIDIWEVDLTKIKNYNFYYDCNLINFGGHSEKNFMTFKSIPPEALKHIKSYKVKKRDYSNKTGIIEVC